MRNNPGKLLKHAFRAAFFDPRKPSVLSIIVENKTSSELIDRALEQLRIAKHVSGIERWAKVRDAVALLAYSMTLEPSSDGS